MAKNRDGSTRLYFDSRKDKPTQAIGKAMAIGARAGVPLFGLKWNALRSLEDELGSVEAAVEWIESQAIRYERPIICEIPREDGMGTAVIGPPGWSEMKLMGFIAGNRDAIAQQFGEITHMGTMRAR